jgi:iron complex transport system substrate-binding protein
LFARLFYCGRDFLSFLGLKISSTIVGALMACGLAPSAFALRHHEQQVTVSQAQDSTAATGKPATKIVTDETGRRVTVPLNAQRVVSLAPNLTETVYALGLENKLSGDTTYCDTPVAAKDKPHVGAPLDPSLEAIVALHPDLVLATAINRWETVEALERLGIAVYTMDPHTVRDMLESTALLGDLLGAHEQAATLVAKLQSMLDDLQTRLRDRPLVHVLFLVWDDPPITIGQNTFIADALRWAGAESVLISDQDWPHISMEEVVRLAPEYIVIVGDHDKPADPNKVNDLRQRPTWSQLEAVKLGHVVVVNDVMTRPSPGLIAGIVALAHSLHPEVFTVERRDSGMEQRKGGWQALDGDNPVGALCAL